MQYFFPFTKTIIPTNGRIAFPLCGETDITLSSTFAKFLTYFISIVYNLSLGWFITLTPICIKEDCEQSSFIIKASTYTVGLTSCNTSTYTVGLTSCSTSTYMVGLTAFYGNLRFHTMIRNLLSSILLYSKYYFMSSRRKRKTTDNTRQFSTSDGKYLRSSSDTFLFAHWVQCDRKGSSIPAR